MNQERREGQSVRLEGGGGGGAVGMWGWVWGVDLERDNRGKVLGEIQTLKAAQNIFF